MIYLFEENNNIDKLDAGYERFLIIARWIKGIYLFLSRPHPPAPSPPGEGKKTVFTVMPLSLWERGGRRPG
jgi:hypothetical protein